MPESGPPPPDEIKISKDSYSKARGGPSQLLDISCAQCDKRVMIYQKDGKGSLIRTYIDRIKWPPELAALQDDPEINTKQGMDNLTCPSCDNVIGTPMEYESEHRLAYRMKRGGFKKTKYEEC